MQVFNDMKKKVILVTCVVACLVTVIFCVKQSFDERTATSYFKGDGWQEPTWQEMLTKSDVILLGEVLQNGTWQTRIRPIKIFKGKLDESDIWIAGYNDYYGSPESNKQETFRKNEKYVLFLKKHSPYPELIQLFEKEAGLNLVTRRFTKALKENKVYKVWTPSAGDILVNGNMAHYDLLEPSWSKYKEPKLYSDFEEFLENTIAPNPQYTERILANLERSLTRNSLPNTPDQYLMMLDLIGNRVFYPVFNQLAKDTSAQVRYALAVHLNRVEWQKAQPLLQKFLTDSSPALQTVALRQLFERNPQAAAPILLASLNSSITNIAVRPNIMTAQTNAFASPGVTAEVIALLAEVKYRKAAPRIKEFLKSTDENVFFATVYALHELGESNLDEYVNAYLEKGQVKDMLALCQLIETCRLKTVYKGLFHFIDKYPQRSPEADFAIDCLSKFDRNGVEPFLLRNLQKYIQRWDTIDFQHAAVSRYVETLTALKSIKAAEMVRHVLYDYYGIDENFVKNNRLFAVKKHLEDSLENSIKQYLKRNEYKVAGIKTVVKMTNTKDIAKSKNVKHTFEYMVYVNLQHDCQAHRNADTEAEQTALDSGLNEKINYVQKILQKHLRIPEYNICVKKGALVTHFAPRFESDVNKPVFVGEWMLIETCGKYMAEVASQENLALLKTLQQNDFLQSGSPDDARINKSRLEDRIREIEQKLIAAK